ncbi:tripartite tricarboxylate transporter substrate binding protein [Sodalis ligni]|uniref:Putative tricarboxylic transport membrane protein n=1 Tax=Sodalis ligni TaxID=2697027 RepID=A0A4R1N876_9GAMM|nr:tripartite tricarboxylate transporter substrate-binding protein [Sodalis ligni]QWA13046.1 tripartite tricarboxylate transporter substrate binding protein [Sodalis ligni]TCL03403.1 putative tricarboxylic transport membrane protein [Sodalis ligni]
MMILRRVAYLAVAGLLMTTLAACNDDNDAAKPSNVQFVVDTGPGGGSDLFARNIVKIARQNKIMDDNWPVLSRPQGGGLGAMNFMGEKKGQPNFIAAFTSKWISSGYTEPNATTTVKDLTVIALLADEQQIVAVPANSPYHTFKEFLDGAKQNPGQLVQVGGAYQSVDNLAALQIEKNTGTSWKYLSFADGGPRITALLRGDAQIMIGAQTDFSEQVAAGQMRLIGVLGDARSKQYPDVPTLAEQGIPTQGIPDQLQFRGIAGPANMKPETVAYYRDIFAKLVKTPDWDKYMQEEGDRTLFVTGDDLNKTLDQYSQDIQQLIKLLKGNK